MESTKLSARFSTTPACFECLTLDVVSAVVSASISANSRAWMRGNLRGNRRLALRFLLPRLLLRLLPLPYCAGLRTRLKGFDGHHPRRCQGERILLHHSFHRPQ